MPEEKIVILKVHEIREPKHLLHPNPDLGELEELAQSIREQGLINPIVVRETEEGYELVSGYRRFLACKKFGINEIPARILSIDEKQAAIASATENLQRTDQDVVEEGKLYKMLIEKEGLQISEIAKKLGKSVPYIESRLILLDMPEVIQNMARNKELQLGMIPHLAKLETESDKVLLAVDLSRRKYSIEGAKHVIEAFIKYKKQMQEKKPEEILQKAREEPVYNCDWCKNDVKITLTRQQIICEECYRRLMFLDEREKRAG